MQIGAVSSASARAAGENPMVSLMSEWRLAALLVSAGQSMQDSMGLFGTCVADETKEAHHMHLFLASAEWCTVTGLSRCWFICLEDGLRILRGVLALCSSGVVWAPHAPHGVGLGGSGMMLRF